MIGWWGFWPALNHLKTTAEEDCKTFQREEQQNSQNLTKSNCFKETVANFMIDFSRINKFEIIIFFSQFKLP